MDASIQRALNDKLYDKRKVGALEFVCPDDLVDEDESSRADTYCAPM